jgi:hypothetical protein
MIFECCCFSCILLLIVCKITYLITTGFTHWEYGDMGPDFIQQRSEMFFAPSHIQKRLKDWGPEMLEQITAAFMQSTIRRSASWLKLTQLEGLNGLSRCL